MIRPLFIVLTLTGVVAAQDQAPVVPGLFGSHPLDQRGVGEVLLEELRCAACHLLPGTAQPAGPDLSEVGWRIAPDYLQRFLSDPAGTQPGSKMPHLLGADPAAAADLAAFLRAGSERGFVRGEVSAAEAARGEALFHDVGCVACHAPRVPAQEGGQLPQAPGAVPLDHVPAKYGLESLADFLFQPLSVRPAGRMPDLGLTRAESRAVASYLLGAGAGEAMHEAGSSPEQVARGGRRFEELGCAGCHALEGVPAPTARRSGDLQGGAGCFSPEPGSAPRYGLDSGQRDAIVAALAAIDSMRADARRVAHTLTQFNCIACHARDDYGGPSAAMNPYFRSDQLDLGDHARVPPSLTLAGAKLREEWTAKVLFNSASVRPYMHARMPQFGEQNLNGLVEEWTRLDEVEPYPLRPPAKGDEEKAWREAGRQLMGNTGLACIACHNFNGKTSPTFQGVDLINSPERLRYDWFARFLISPQEYRPGIVMPESWPGGVAAHQKILAGNTEEQIQALWHFLRLGRSARDPVGITTVRTRLEVTDAVRTYRGRSGMAGFRGIAVGFPGGLSYAFDAYTGAMVGVWRGEFVSVNWQGQGAGDFNPIGRAAGLPRDVAFVRLEDENTPWPLRPVKTKEEPIDPDPLYPASHGYHFLGYHLDQDDVPTLRYRTGAILVQDRSVADLSGERPVLKRSLRLEVSAAETVYLRVLSGEFERPSPGVARRADLQLSHGDLPALERGAGDTHELLLRLDLEPGVTTLHLAYELLR